MDEIVHAHLAVLLAHMAHAQLAEDQPLAVAADGLHDVLAAEVEEPGVHLQIAGPEARHVHMQTEVLGDALHMPDGIVHRGPIRFARRVGGQQPYVQVVPVEGLVEVFVVFLEQRQIGGKAVVVVHGQLVGEAVIADLADVPLLDEIFQIARDVLGVFAAGFVAEVELSLGAGEVDGRVGDLLHSLVIVGERVHALLRPVGIAAERAHEAGRQLAVAFADLLIELLFFAQAVEQRLAVVEAQPAEERREVRARDGQRRHGGFLALFSRWSAYGSAGRCRARRRE